jgi:hypothetical protein
MKLGLASVALAPLLLLAAACNNDDPNKLLGSGDTGAAGCPSTTQTTGNGGSGGGTGGNGGSTGTTSGSTTTPTPTVKTVLDERVLSYTEALRTASLKLVGNAPTLEEMMAIQNAPDTAAKKAKYEELIDQMMADVRFKKRLVEFWRNTFRMAGAKSGNTPSRDTAPTFAARVVFEQKPFTDLLTATEHTCPTFDGSDFADGECPNGPPGMETVGILTDPGIHAQYYGNLAFRRVRFFQEVFACRKMPAEYDPKAKDPPPIAGCEMAQAYTNPWDFTKIAGHASDPVGRIDFQDCSSVICANCHGTINHRAPIFANFDENGKWQPQFSVLLPITNTPVAEMTDYLVPGEPTGWKKDMPAADIKAMGQAMATDPEVLECAVSRVWNYAMSKGDIVGDSASLDPTVIASLVQKFKASGFNLNATWRATFTHDDFVRF